MDQNEDGTLTIFVPASPALTVGTVHVVNPDRVTRLEAGISEFTGCVSQWGIGSRKVLSSPGPGAQRRLAGSDQEIR